MLMEENMSIEERIPFLDKILGEWQETIGQDYEGYKNHVYRMVNFCFALKPCNDEEREKVLIAGCFHDLGIWVGGYTADYICPSLPPAREYLQSRGLEHWRTEIELMITEHHKITEYKNESYPLVEVFRKADLVDFSLGIFKCGLSADYVNRVKAKFPNAGFHANLVRLATQWFARHPLNPAPMMKW